jgi:putative ABC transport system ATP-binding protein
MVLFDELYRQDQTIILVTHEHDIAAHARRQVHLRDGAVERDFATEGTA